MRDTRGRYTLSLLLFVVLFAGCSATGNDGGLVIYSGRSEDLVQPLIDQFVTETGINVAVRYAGSSDLAATILEEGGSSPADLFFAQDPASLGTVALAGLFTRLGPIHTDKVPAQFSDSQSRWVGISGRARVVVYDATRVSPDDLPETEDGFTESRWSGETAIAPTNGSFLAFVAAKILDEGEEVTSAWLDAMASNKQPTYAKNSSIVAAVNAGEVKTGLVNHYYLLRALAVEPNEVGRNFSFSVPTAGAIVMPAGIGILESSDNKKDAEAFVAFMLSTAAQTYFSEVTFEYPLVHGVEANEQLPPLASIPTPDIDLSRLAEVLDLATDLVAAAGLI